MTSRLTSSAKGEVARLVVSLAASAAATLSLRQLMGDASLWPLGACLWGLYRVWRFWSWLDAQRALRREAPESLSAADLLQGDAARLPLGEGFVWGAEQAQLIYDYQAQRGELPFAPDDQGSFAFHGVGHDRVRPLHLPAEALRQHLLIEGRTRSGKSQLATVFCRALIARSRGAVVVIEPKDEPDLVGHLIGAAHQAGRKLAVFSPYAPHLSCRLNPLSTCGSASEVRARLSALTPASREPYFGDRGLLVLERAAAMQRAVGEPWELAALLRDATLTRRRLQLAARYLAVLGARLEPGEPSAPALAAAYARSGLSDDLAEYVLEDLMDDPQHYREVTDNLQTALGDVIHAEWRELLTDPGGLSWREIDEDEMVVIVLTASLLSQELSRKISKLILQDFMGHMGRRLTLDNAAERRPIYLVADELAQMAYAGVATAVAMVGGAGGRLITMWQSRAGLAKEMGEHAAQELVDNIQTRVYLAMTDDAASRRIAESMGEREVWTTQASRRRDGDSGFSGSRAVSAVRRRLVEPEWLAALPPGHGWARLGGRHYKMAAPLLEPFDAAVVEAMGYGDLVETIRRQKEQARRERIDQRMAMGLPAGRLDGGGALASGNGS